MAKYDIECRVSHAIDGRKYWQKNTFLYLKLGPQRCLEEFFNSVGIGMFLES